MTTYEYAEDIERLVSGGIETDELKWDRAYTIAKLNQGRAVIARNDYKISHNWNPALIQYFYPEYEQYFQSNTCITRFRIPTGFINVDYSTTGLVYAGSSNDDTPNVYKSQNFLKINNRTEFNDLLHHPRMTPTNGIYIGVMFEGLVVTVYGLNIVKKLMLGGVFDEPTLLPDFSLTKDSYPIPIDMFPLIQTYIYQQAFAIEAATPADTISDSKNTIVPNSMSAAINKRLTK